MVSKFKTTQNCIQNEKKMESSKFDLKCAKSEYYWGKLR